MTKNQFLTDANAYIKAITPNYSVSTVKEKSRKLRNYANIIYHLYEEGEITSNAPAKMTADDIHAFVTFRRANGIKEPTIAKDLSIIGMFIKWKENPAMDIYNVQYGNRKPKAYDGKLEPLPDHIIEGVYSIARSTDSWTVLEGCTAVVMCCACGMRPQEARRIYVDDVHLLGDRSTVFIRHVKGEGRWGRTRSVPVMDGAEDIIQKYLDMRRVKLDEEKVTSSALFPALRGKGEFMEQQSFGRLKVPIEDMLGQKFELREGRRAYGQRMLDRGYPIELVSSSMGHASIATTQKYYANYRENKVLDGIFAIKNSERRCSAGGGS